MQEGGTWIQTSDLQITRQPALTTDLQAPLSFAVHYDTYFVWNKVPP